MKAPAKKTNSKTDFFSGFSGGLNPFFDTLSSIDRLHALEKGEKDLRSVFKALSKNRRKSFLNFFRMLSDERVNRLESSTLQLIFSKEKKKIPEAADDEPLASSAAMFRAWSVFFFKRRKRATRTRGAISSG